MHNAPFGKEEEGLRLFSSLVVDDIDNLPFAVDHSFLQERPPFLEDPVG